MNLLKLLCFVLVDNNSFLVLNYYIIINLLNIVTYHFIFKTIFEQFQKKDLLMETTHFPLRAADSLSVTFLSYTVSMCQFDYLYYNAIQEVFVKFHLFLNRLLLTQEFQKLVFLLQIFLLFSAFFQQLTFCTHM